MFQGANGHGRGVTVAWPGAWNDDGAVCVPAAMADKVIEKAGVEHEWEPFTKIMLAKGGDLRRYYPLHPDARPEYDAWRLLNPKK